MPIQENMEKEDFGDAITGIHSAIKQFVEAKKEDSEDSSGDNKKKILKKIVNDKSSK